MKTLIIYELTDDEVTKLVVKAGQVSSEFQAKVTAEAAFRDAMKSMPEGTYPIAIEDDLFEYVECVANGICPLCGRRGEWKREKLDWQDMDERIGVACPIGHEAEIYHSKHGDWM